MGKYFGTDGFRGEANVVLTVEHAFKVGRFLGWYYGKEHKAGFTICEVCFFMENILYMKHNNCIFFTHCI